MNDPAVFAHFVQNVLGVTTPRVRNVIFDFVPTFNDLLSTTDDEIAAFVSTTHSSNSARGNTQKILIPSNVSISLQAMLFELKDRELCQALPDQATLQAITPVHLTALRRARATALEHKKNRSASTSSSMTVPSFKGSNYDEFIAAFKSLASRQIGVNDLPLDYILRDEPPGNYMGVYASREEKLMKCIVFRGDKFKTDRESLYSLFVEHIGTTGVGSAFINKYESTRNGYAVYRDLKQHYANSTYLQNKATAANHAIQNAFYHGPRKNFTIKTYYTIMSNAFNDLNNAGPEYHLTDPQKIVKFEAGLQEDTAIRYAIDAKSTFDRLPTNEQTFDRYYNIFSSLVTKYTTLMSKSPSSSNTRNRGNPPNFIGSTTTNPSNRHGNRGRGSRRGRNRGGRGGRGNGRGGFNSGRGGNNQFTPTYGNFTAEAKIYNPDVFRNLTIQQKKDILQLKKSQGWIDSVTPPHGHTIDPNTGKAVVSNAIISAIQTVTGSNNNQTNGNNGTLPSFINIPPAPSTNPPARPSVPPSQDQSTSNAGSQFGRQGRRNGNEAATISTVSINGQAYTGQVFDQFGNPLN